MRLLSSSLSTKQVSWDMVLAIGLILAIMALSAYGALSRPDETRYPAGSVYSNQPDGARALRLWLDELGYQTVTLEGSRFAPDRTVHLLMMLTPSEGLGRADVNALKRWVNEGGTLVMAGTSFALMPLLDEFELRVEWLAEPVEQLSAAQPLLITPPVHQAQVHAEVVWKTDRHDYVTHMATHGKPVLISFRYGWGRVFAITTLKPFTNAGLKDQGNAALVYNLVLAGGLRQGLVAFDEYHHGFQTLPSFRAWLTTSRSGWAVLYGLAVAFLFLLIGGRHFGRPVPLLEHMARRTTAEYIRAMANLKRRAGHHPAVLAHYKDHLKRQLGKAYRIDPTLTDEAFVQELLMYRHDLDRERLSRLLADLSRRAVSEREMVRLAREAADWMARFK